MTDMWPLTSSARTTIADTVRELADGRSVPDWQARAARLGALCDAGPSAGATAIAYEFPCSPLPEPDRALFARMFHQVESVERLAMSAVAHALVRLSPPDRDALHLCRMFYEEALHLQALTALQDLPACVEPWIAAKREPFWRLLRDTEELLPFVLFQHCLSETEGAIAGAQKLRQLADAGAGPLALQVAQQIAMEETGHAVTGYHMLANLDGGVDGAAFERLIARYLEVEPLVDEALPKGKRQRFALRLARLYSAQRNVDVVRVLLLQEVRAALDGGSPSEPGG